MKIIIDENREVFKETNKIGNDSENKVEVLEFEFPKQYTAFTKYIEFQIKNEKYVDLIENDQYVITRAIAKYGKIKAQIVLRNSLDNDVAVFKSNVFDLKVSNSLNATEDVPTEYPTWIDNLTKLKQDLESSESERISNEDERISAEEERQKNFTEMQKTVENAVSNIKDLKEEYNSNAEKETKNFNDTAAEQTKTFNDNSDSKLAEYNKTHTDKMKEFNDNNDAKTKAFDDNAVAKLGAYNKNDTEKTNAYNANDKAKTDAYNNNTALKEKAYNDNAATKTETFNSNVEQKENELEDLAEEKINEYSQVSAELNAKVEQVQAENETLKSENKLIKEQIPSATASGNSIHVEDSSNLDFEWEINGNQYQATREGYNILQNIVHKNDQNYITNGITFTKNSDGSIVANGTATANARYYFVSEDEARENIKAGTYRITGCPSGGSTTTYRILMGITGVGEKYEYGNGTNITISSDNTYYFAIFIGAGQTVRNLVFKPMIISGTEDKPYEQYGAMPSSVFSSEIETVKDSVEIDVVNSNLIDFNVTQDSRVTVNEDGTLTINGAGGFSLNIDKLQLKAGITYYQKVELISGSISGSNINNTFLSFAGAGVWISSVNFSQTNLTKDTEKTAIWINANAIFNNAVIKIWANTDKSDFVLHQSQTAIMLIQQEMLEGDYVADVEHHEWGKIILTGEEKLIDNVSTSIRTYWGIDFSNYGIYQYNDPTKVCDVLTTKFKSRPQQGTFLPGQVALITSNKNMYFVFEPDTTEEQARAILKDMPVYFRLATPINLELAEKQKKVREQTLYTYKNITNISLSDELASIDIEYKKDIETIEKNIESRLAALETASTSEEAE